MDKKRIVILGGGYAGVHAAKRMHKAFKKMRDRVEIVLIDRHNSHILMTELHEVAGNRVEEDSVRFLLTQSSLARWSLSFVMR